MTGTATAGQSAKGTAWAVLIGMGGTSTVFNVWHATHAGHMLLMLALLYGVAPVAAAAGLSHIVAAYKGGWFMQAVTFAVMLGAMGLSIGATASVVAPTAGPVLRWLFGAVLDAAALIALRVILAERGQKAAEQAAGEATARAAAEAIAQATGVPSAEPVPEPRREPRRTMPGPSKDPDAERARRAYRKSVLAGHPLTDRALGDMFDRSRTWGGTRIGEVRSASDTAGASSGQA